MPAMLDTRGLPHAERAAAAVAFLENTDMPSRLMLEPGEHLGHRFDGWSLVGGAQVLDVEGSGLRVTRTARHVRAAAPERLCLAMQFCGEGRSEHRGIAALTPPGHLNLIDCTSESDYHWTGTATRRVFLVEYTVLGLSVDRVRAAAGRLPVSPLYDLTRSHLRSLRLDHEEFRASAAGTALAVASVELVRALVATAADPDTARDASAHGVLRLRIADYIERHLSDTRLSAETIAAAHHISVRQLYVVWSASPMPLREWIIHSRLEQVRRRLALSSSVPVATVARRYGFTNVSHFARRFREAYGMPPGEWQRHFAR
jgi:AraC-like DNA-binding protein